jgi:serine protein kinase
MSDLQKKLEDLARQATNGGGAPICLNEYLELVSANPLVAATAPERIYDMIAQEGFTPGVEARKAAFFSEELFDLERPLEQLVGYFDSAAQGHETRHRILLLWGPPGGAKSSIVAILKRGLEAYSRTERGALYALDGCPMHEEPLHLVPQESGARDDVHRHYGVRIEGQLCPVCRYRLEHEFAGDFMQFPIRRIFFSEARRVGIATFEPSDPKSMSIEMLTSGINFRAIEEHGSDDHPLALDWAGEFVKANRGLFEAVEFFKNPREFLFSFLSLAQESQFKIPKFGYISADIAVVAHTNESEYRAFMADPKNEALRDRLFTVAVPYSVRRSSEHRIYEKLLAGAQGRSQFHVAPYTLQTAATVAVLSRLTAHENLAPIDKLKLYDGHEVGEWKLAQVPEIKRKAEHEGTGGLGPRRIIDVLASAAVKRDTPAGECPCLDPIATLVTLRTHIEQMELEREHREHLLALITDARQELDRELKDEVRKAFVPAFGEKAQDLLENYLTNVEAHCQNTKLRDPITGEEVAPDEKLMRAVEEQVGVTENAKDAFRQGVLVRIGITLRNGRPLTYRSDDQLGKAIEGYLFEQLKDVIQVTVSKTSPDPEQAKRLNEVLRVMADERGYCPQCASIVLDYVGQLLHR